MASRFVVEHQTDAVAKAWLRPQLDAVFEHGLAWARSQAFYDQTLFWQWMRLPGDVVFSVGTLVMCWDFLVKLRQPRTIMT